MSPDNKKVICCDIHGNEYEVLAKELLFRPSVYGVIIKEGKILLSKQWDGYDLPGGGVNLGETIQEALVREVKEETGLSVKVGDLIACEDSFFRSDKGDHFQGVLLYYICQPIGGDLTTEFFDGDEKEYTDMPEWVELSEIDKIKFISTIDCAMVVKKVIKLYGNLFT